MVGLLGYKIHRNTSKVQVMPNLQSFAEFYNEKSTKIYNRSFWILDQCVPVTVKLWGQH